MRLLCVSNGHGEDVIGVKILQMLRQLAPQLVLGAMPIVGAGRAYSQAGFTIVGPTKQMPSGGFIYMDGSQLARDLQGGLVQLTRSQLRAIGEWLGPDDRLLAVGDIVPLVFGWLSRRPYGFVGTAKSEYYLWDGEGSYQGASGLPGWLDLQRTCVYLPWERWLMARSRCVFPRDRLTCERLRRWNIPVYEAGNPMMDGFEVPATTPEPTAPLEVLLLPGSRPPEAYENWQLLLAAAASVEQPAVFLAALAPALEQPALVSCLAAQGWLPEGDGYRRGQSRLVLGVKAFKDYAQRASVAIATAGTATEQFVGLGKPVVTLPGPGPQFTYAFAEAQSRHLGPSIRLVAKPAEVGAAITEILSSPPRQHRIYKNGLERMGPPGAGQRIAKILLETLLV